MSTFGDFMIGQAVEKDQEIHDLIKRVRTAESLLGRFLVEWEKDEDEVITAPLSKLAEDTREFLRKVSR